MNFKQILHLLFGPLIYLPVNFFFFPQTSSKNDNDNM